MGDTFSDDYQTVAERIRIFREKYPEGSLRPADPAVPFKIVTVAGQEYVVVMAAAYRHPDDKAPGIGQAWEVVPGLTEYTLGSELMNAESSAWGRATIATLAADSRKIASADEVRAAQQRRAQGPRTTIAPGPQAPAPAPVEPARVSVQQASVPDPVAAQQAPQQPPVQATVEQLSVPAPAAAPPPQVNVAQPKPEPPKPESEQLTLTDTEESNRDFVESIYANVLKHPDSTITDLRDAWLIISQAGMLHWRVDPINGMDPDSDGKVTIGALATHLGQQKSKAQA